MLATKNADVRSTNKRRVAEFLLRNPGATQQALQRSLSLSSQTVITVLKLLEEEGVLERGEALSSTGGRPPVSLSLKADARYALGATVFGRKLRLAAVDLRGQIRALRVMELPINENSSFDGGWYFWDREFIPIFGEMVHTFLQTAGIPADKIIGLGIAVSGAISEGRWISGGRNNDTEKLQKEITSETGLQTLLLRADQAAGIAESWMYRTGDAVCLSLGFSVGGAVLSGGSPRSGKNGHAGSLGHIIIHPGGRPCPCGRLGCLGMYCIQPNLSGFSESLEGQKESGLSVRDFLLSRPPAAQWPDLQSFFAEAEAGEQAAVRRLEQYLSDLALGIASVVAVEDRPVILCGEVSQYLGSYMEKLQALTEAVSGGDFPVELRLGHYGASADEIGAAMIWHRRYLSELL